MPVARGFHRGDPLRRRSQRIASQVHGRGAGVIGLAGEFEAEPGLAHNASDGRDAQSFGLQHRALLDVDLDEAQYIFVHGCFVRSCEDRGQSPGSPALA